MGKQYDHLGSFFAYLIDHGLESGFIDPEFPAGCELCSVSQWSVRKSLPNNGYRNAILLAHDIRIKNRLGFVFVHDILGNKSHLVLEIIPHHLQDTLCAVGKFPMPSHDINTQFQRSLHHVLSRRPKRCG